MKAPTYPATVCTCADEDRRWNGYGSCEFCGGAYDPPAGPLAAIVIPRRPPTSTIFVAEDLAARVWFSRPRRALSFPWKWLTWLKGAS